MSEIDYRDPRPIYEQLAGVFEDMILKGVLEKGSKMPSVRDTAAHFSVNPNTVQKAYTLLEANGIICTVRGKGSFVCDDKTADNAIKENA